MKVTSSGNKSQPETMQGRVNFADAITPSEARQTIGAYRVEDNADEAFIRPASIGLRSRLDRPPGLPQRQLGAPVRPGQHTPGASLIRPPMVSRAGAGEGISELTELQQQQALQTAKALQAVVSEVGSMRKLQEDDKNMSEGTLLDISEEMCVGWCI